MADYLDRIGAGFIIAHPEFLDYDHVPEELVGQEDIQSLQNSLLWPPHRGLPEP